MASAHEQKKPDVQFAGDLVPRLVDTRAKLTPDAICSEYPISAWICDEIHRMITYEQQAQTGKSMRIVNLLYKDVDSGAGNRASDRDLEKGLRAVSAANLSDFYDDSLTSGDGAPNRLDTADTIRSSKKLREMQGFQGDWIRKWIREWLVSRK